MSVTKEHIVDKGPINERGFPADYYEYDVYRFQQGEVALVARSYTDESTGAHFLSVLEQGTRRLLDEDDFQTRLFEEAVHYLKKEGKTTLLYLTREGYRLLVEEKDT